MRWGCEGLLHFGKDYGTMRVSCQGKDADFCMSRARTHDIMGMSGNRVSLSTKARVFGIARVSLAGERDPKDAGLCRFWEIVA